MNANSEAEAPPLHPKVSPEQLEKMSPEEQGDYASKIAIAAVNRYGGNPDLMLRENPHLDFRNAAQ